MIVTDTSIPFRKLILLWLAWAILVIGFQALVDWRLQPARPDESTGWTADETQADSQDGKIYLLDPFMNAQVSWDSEYYLSIAVGGYDDPDMRLIEVRDGNLRSRVRQNFAFFPLYPQVMHYVSLPLSILGMTPIATATLAGVLVSLLGTLGGMIGLYDLTCEHLGEAGALRAVFYMLIFPTGFFLAQVYTEGLFIGLAFGSLALIHHKRWLAAGALAALATWTRSVGAALVVPLALAWLQTVDWRRLREAWRAALIPLVAILLPVGAYLIFRQIMGHNFDLIQDQYFGRRFLNMIVNPPGVEWGVNNMLTAFRAPSDYTQMFIYYLLEIASLMLALVACMFTLRRYTGLALFSLAVLFISVTSGAPQSLIRYVLVVPSLFIFLATLGKHFVFDRAWTILSLLLMSMEVALFTWDMWVA